MRKDVFVKNVGKCKREEELVCNRSDEEIRVGKGEKTWIRVNRIKKKNQPKKGTKGR